VVVAVATGNCQRRCAEVNRKQQRALTGGTAAATICSVTGLPKIDLGVPFLFLLVANFLRERNSSKKVGCSLSGASFSPRSRSHVLCRAIHLLRRRRMRRLAEDNHGNEGNFRYNDVCAYSVIIFEHAGSTVQGSNGSR
jgi:hypothetical protein